MAIWAKQGELLLPSLLRADRAERGDLRDIANSNNDVALATRL